MDENIFIVKMMKQNSELICEFLGIEEEQYKDYCSMDDLFFDISSVYKQMPEEYIQKFEKLIA